MKTTETLREVTSTLEGERVAMGIDEAAMAHIMTVLTRLYSDQELAVIREYSTNAYDAHVEAGVTRPIEVSLPTPLAPFFKVRDYGFGLDEEDIRTIYSRYGTSTKRDSNDVVGMLGLGCKSALAYTDQFTLSSVKNGVCTQVSISRDENGSGVMTIVAQYETDEPSGTEITIPTRSRNEFPQKAANFYKYWAAGSVLVDGEEPKRIDGLWLSEDICLTAKTETNYIVMGNVAYPTPYEYSNLKYSYVAFVPIGSVNFTPSRESLEMTKLTKQTLAEVSAKIEGLKKRVGQERVDAAPSKPEALKEMLEVSALLNIRVKSYGKFEFPAEFKRDRTAQSAYRTIHGEKQRRQADKGHRQFDLPIALAARAVFVTGYDANTSWTPTRRTKLNMFWAQKRAKDANFQVPETVVLLDEFGKTDNKAWIDKDRIVTWAEINAIKIPREGKTGMTQDGRPSGSYRGYKPGERYQIDILAADLDTSKPIFYDDQKYPNHNARMVVQEVHPDATYVLMSPNRVAKFCRDFPQAQKATDFAKVLAAQWAEKLNEDQRIRLVLDEDHDLKRKLTALDPEKIDDPHLRKTVYLAKSKSRNPQFIQTAREMRRWVQMPSPNHGWEHPETKYALLTHVHVYGSMDADTAAHLHVYLNAAYAAGKGQ